MRAYRRRAVTAVRGTDERRASREANVQRDGGYAKITEGTLREEIGG